MGHRFLIAVVIASIGLVSAVAANRPVPKPAPKAKPVAPHFVAPHVAPTLPAQVHPSTGHPNTIHQVLAHPIVHPNMKGPQRSHPFLKTDFMARSSKIQQRLHESGHWRNWHHHWIWGTYAYLLPGNTANTVIGVPSGNTLSISGIPATVRLAGVGAPGLGNGQAFFSSRDSLDGLANGKLVRVFQVGVDLNGNVVAQVFLQDNGAYLNEQQIHSGMAWNSAEDGFDPSLAVAEEEAQMAGAGLWNGDYAEAPWFE
jgi:endonuclease YncB( thermonuclease family)